MAQKTLIYSLVAQGTVILAEYTEFTGNFTSIAHQWLQRLPTVNAKFSHSHDGHSFNFLVLNGFTYCVVATASAGIEVPKTFLERIKEDFTKSYGGEISKVQPNKISKDFGKKLKEHMKYFTDHPEEISKVAAVSAQLSEIKLVMEDNIKLVYERHEKLEDLTVKTNKLQNEAGEYKKGAQGVRRKMWLNNMKIKLIVLCIIIVLILIIILSICHGFKC